MSAQTNKQKRLDQMRQLNTLLENKNYSNGALRAKLQQSYDFLSIATRELGIRKLATERLQDGIADFECKLKKGLKSAKMIQVCGAKIDSFLMVIEHKIATMRRLRIERIHISTEIRQKCEQTEKKDRWLRSAIKDAHNSARKWGNEKVSLRTKISKLDNDKIIAQNAEQMTELQIQGTEDKIKIEAERVASSKRTLFKEMEDVNKQRETVSSEIKISSTTLETLRHEDQQYHEKIVECSKVEGYHQGKGITLVFDQNIFRNDIERIEEETKRDEDDLRTLKKSIEDTELACKISIEKTLQNDKDASLIVSAAKSLAEEEEKRQKYAMDFQVSLERTRAEVAKLVESVQEMEATRKFEARANLKAISDYDDNIGHQTKSVEDLKLKMKLEDTSLKTKIRLFEATEIVPLQKKLEETKNKSLSQEKKYHDLVNLSGDALIESKLQAEFKLKIDDETAKLETKIKSVISRCEEHLQSKLTLLYSFGLHF